MTDLLAMDMLLALAAGLTAALAAVTLLTDDTGGDGHGRGRNRGRNRDRNNAGGGAGGGAGPGDLGGPVLLFDGTELADSVPPAEILFGDGAAGLSWQRLRERLAPRCPDLPASPDRLPDGRQTAIAAAPVGPGGKPVDGKGNGKDGAAGGGEILLERRGRMTRVRLTPGLLGRGGMEAGPGEDPEMLREALAAMPFPAWRTAPNGEVVWHNRAYAALLRKVRGALSGAHRPLFDPERDRLMPGRRVRVALQAEGGGRKLWYDVTMVGCRSGRLFFAADANAVAEAEAAQRNFVQTLAKTFAQLSIGLAIFDRNRQLALFNPALTDLTSLPATFLSSRPTLPAFFDRLRDSGVMPEPKDYGSWRQRMAELDAAAADGRYQETWTLPSGSVYAVSGRPHPDGAVAFLFEDITAEITLTRRFRSELELGQAVLDGLDDAIAVFSPEGTLAFSNAGFRRIWGTDPEDGFARMTIREATRLWQQHSLPTPAWGDLRDFVAQRENRAEWTARIGLRAGGALLCTVTPLRNGATMVRFRPCEPDPATALAAASDLAGTTDRPPAGDVPPAGDASPAAGARPVAPAAALPTTAPADIAPLPAMSSAPSAASSPQPAPSATPAAPAPAAPPMPAAAPGAAPEIAPPDAAAGTVSPPAGQVAAASPPAAASPSAPSATSPAGAGPAATPPPAASPPVAPSPAAASPAATVSAAAPPAAASPPATVSPPAAASAARAPAPEASSA